MTILTKCFEGLEAYKSIGAGDTHKFLVREQILDNLNIVVIISRIPHDPLLCVNHYLTRFPGKIITHPEYRAYFMALKELNLNNNHLTQLPAEIRLLSALKVLRLDNNQLLQLPAEIGQLRLQRLHVSNNQLTQLPAEIGQLVGLGVLDLSKNQITQLPSEIEQMIALWQLNLSRNRLTLLPAEIGQLRFLWQLNLTNNHLTELPDNLEEYRLFQWEIGAPTRDTKAEVLASQTQPTPALTEEDSHRSAPKP